MKISHSLQTRSGWRSRRREDASAVIVVIAILAIVFVYVAGNLRTLHFLGRELRLLERQQIHRLEIRARPAAARRMGLQAAPQEAAVRDRKSDPVMGTDGIAGRN